MTLLSSYFVRTRKRMRILSDVRVTIDIRGFTGLEMPNELHNRGALTDAHAHAALIIQWFAGCLTQYFSQQGHMDQSDSC